MTAESLRKTKAKAENSFGFNFCQTVSVFRQGLCTFAFWTSQTADGCLILSKHCLHFLSAVSGKNQNRLAYHKGTVGFEPTIKDLTGLERGVEPLRCKNSERQIIGLKSSGIHIRQCLVHRSESQSLALNFFQHSHSNIIFLIFHGKKAANC